MTLEELALFNELFSSRFGLQFPEHKREILESRLAPRLRANHVQRYLDYYLLLQYDLLREHDALVQAITNNESYFFREITQFEALRDESLDALRRESASPGQLRVLSAGCSSGEEPYTLNIFLRDFSRGADGDDLVIDAVDIDTERLAAAQRAIYRPSSLRALDDEQIERYFTRRDDDTYALRSLYRRGVHFSTGNILDRGSLRPTVPYDAVFCRNVLIYFSEAALKATIDNFARILRPGGLLFLGHSESIIGLTTTFQAERIGQCIGYRRISD